MRSLNISEINEVFGGRKAGDPPSPLQAPKETGSDNGSVTFQCPEGTRLFTASDSDTKTVIIMCVPIDRVTEV